MCNNNERIFPIFRHFKHFAPCTIQWGEIQVQNFVFLTSELKSTHNFSLENMFYSCFWDTSYFHTFGNQVRVRSQTLSCMFLCCLFVSSVTWETQSETIQCTLPLLFLEAQGMYVQWRVQHIKRGSPRCAKPVSSAPSFSEPVFKRTTAFLANKIPFPKYARHTVYNLFASTGPFQFPPDNRQKWWVWVSLLRTLLCMLRDEVLQIK